MSNQKTSNTVRRNVTMDKCVANDLEAASKFTGYSQSDILEIALKQPLMRRLYVFVHPSEDNPLVELLDIYQAYEGHMNPRVGEKILSTVRQWFEKHAAIRDQSVLAIKASYVNSYIYGHMTEGSKKAHPYFKQVYEETKQDLFITQDMEETEFKNKMIKYVDAMLSGPLDKNRMGEPFLFRNLLIVLSECFKSPTTEEVRKLFEELSDGYVLPYFSVM